MKDWQQRAVDEAEELEERGRKLYSFIYGDIFLTLGRDEQVRLSAQLGFMEAYADTLEARIDAFQN